MERGQVFTIIFVMVLVIIASVINVILSANNTSSILEKRLQCISYDNFGVGSQSENGNAYCSSMNKKCLIAERYVKLSRHLDDSKAQTYLIDAYSQRMGCEVSFKNFDEESELVSGNDPDLFVNVEFNAICCG